MDINKQTQQAGDRSQQIQAGKIIINQGISEERVRTVFGEMIPKALDEYAKEAYAKANERIENWENSVLPRINEVQGMLEAFGDPAFQRLLRKAQQAAAVTDEKADYDLLTELLICHVKKGENRKNRASILNPSAFVYFNSGSLKPDESSLILFKILLIFSSSNNSHSSSPTNPLEAISTHTA